MADQADGVLAIRVADVKLGVRLSDIKEIMSTPSAGITRAPTFPKCVLGIINVRGRIVPVVNTWLCLDEREPEDFSDCVILLCAQNNELVGFIADELLSTIDSFESYEEAYDDVNKKRLCNVDFRTVNGVVTGLVKTSDIYAAARQIASKGEVV